ncbi:helix-turn-helix domain-containing protein [Streptomyces sp. 7N604]|uniref:helix-turn-helix domain-containing protein n=1 Tax=Streptomyces sp. 7N604 TaxID=3457415 RepID=UPI003FD3B569
MNWSSQALKLASQQGDFGRVIRLARQAARVTQRQLGEACGITQSAVSRLEGHGVGTYNMTILARAAVHLGIPPRLVGLADTTAAHAAQGDGQENVERRGFLASSLAVAAAPTLAAIHAAPDSRQAAALRLATTAFRRMDGSTPSRHLAEAVLAHVRLIQTIASESGSAVDRTRLAAVGSEAASLAAWLSWDMGDHGSARAWYGSAVRSARRSGDQVLTAYQVGSLAQFEAQ